MEAVVSDFGFARAAVESGAKTTSNVGPIKWMAPECLTQRLYSTKTDVYAFGITAWEVITRLTPYPTLDNVNTILFVTSGRRLDIPEYCPAELGQLIQQCWDVSPTVRPTMEEIYN